MHPAGRPQPSPDDLLYDLDGPQRRAVTSAARPLAILAPAGSGKTRVLTRRIAWRCVTEDADPPHVLALTFTRKAAGELRERLSRLGLRDGVAAGTFHGLAYAQLRGLWRDRSQSVPTLLSRKGPLLAEAIGPDGHERGGGSGSGPGGPTPAALATEIEWAKSRLLGPDDYAESAGRARRRPVGGIEAVADGYRRYEQLKQRNAMVDFDDLLKLCSDALLTDPAFAAAQRWRFRHLFVDEFQDVNPLQLRLLDAWRGTRHDLCVVGDPQQAIYGWNGADPGFLREFRTRYPPAEVIELEHNYRSTPQVLRAADQVLRRAKLDPAPVEATLADGDAPAITRHPTDMAEATAVARAVRDARAPTASWASQAVLVRTHSQIGLVTEAMRAAGIPHRVRGSANLLDDPDVRTALDMLRGDDRPLGSSLSDLDSLAEEVRQRSPAPRSGPPPLLTLIDMARDHHRLDTRATSAGFVAWAVATLNAEAAEGGADTVTIATFHAAKGLEWPVVHLAGLEDGFVPITHARTAAARAEEARLLYVAMTRAARTLHCTWAASRTFNGRTVDRRICPWLQGLAEESRRRASEPAATRSGRAPDWRDRLAEQRAQLARARPEPEPALAAAQAWREEVARRARVDPGTVVDDELLEAVVAAGPSSREELAAVPGMGPMLVARLGDGLLDALAEPER